MRVRLVFLVLMMSCVWGRAEAVESETTLADQTDVAVTAYNNGLALVRDVREIALPKGEVHLKFMDVAQQIRPESVSLRSLAVAGSATILEQNYEYDLMSPAKLMEKYVGKEVKLVNFSREIGFEEVAARLLNTNQGPIYEIGDAIYLGHPGYVVLPEIPENLIAKPSLIWLLHNERSDQRIEAAYLTNGISWQADYVITLARDDASLDLAGWVTMNNRSGATYANAKLKLVAGEVNVVRRGRAAGVEVGYGLKALGYLANGLPQEESFAEYHLYTMPRRTTIRQNQSKQLALLSAAGLACAKKYEFRGQEHFYSQQMAPMPQESVDVVLEFENEEGNHLGIPLPAGVMRIYQADREGAMQFAGEDRIKHTPKDETVRLRMGKAFDVVGERVQKNYERISRILWEIHESEYEITLRNHKNTDIIVDVIEPMPGDWDIRDASHPFEKKDARTAVFHVRVRSDGKAKVTYRVRVKR